jgi:hypothetical protein
MQDGRMSVRAAGRHPLAERDRIVEIRTWG